MWLLAMTLQQATLPTPRFDQIELENLKQDIQQAIQAGQEFFKYSYGCTYRCSSATCRT